MIRMYAIVVVVLLVGFAGCQDKGAVEKTGERVDEIIDNIKDGDQPLKKKGTLEKMGESVDKTFDSESK